MNSIKEICSYKKANKVELAKPMLKKFKNKDIYDSELKQLND